MRHSNELERLKLELTFMYKKNHQMIMKMRITYEKRFHAGSNSYLSSKACSGAFIYYSSSYNCDDHWSIIE